VARLIDILNAGRMNFYSPFVFIVFAAQKAWMRIVHQMKWQYKNIFISQYNLERYDVIHELNCHGNDGWEVILCVPEKDGISFIAKRAAITPENE